MTLTLTHPRVIVCGCIAICLLIFYRSTQEKTIIPFFQFTSFIQQSPQSLFSLWLYRSLVLFIIGLCFFILSYPKQVQQKQNISKSGIDIVIALDVSFSMEANDLTPNRLASAKRALQQFLGTRVSDRVGLVLFAGKPFISVPLTFDYRIFDEILSRVSTSTINQNYQHLQGTAIGDALLSSITLLDKEKNEENSKRERIIVLFTDGEANVGVDPKVVAQLAAEKQIKLYTIGIGSLEGGTIQTPTAFGMRQQRVNGVDEATLRSIAEQTNGLYARAVNDSSLEEIINQIAKLTRTDAEMEKYDLYKDARGPFVIILLISMVVLVYLDRKVLL